MRKQILIVDDEILIQKSLQTFLQKSGHDVETSSSGEEAMEQLGEKFFNIVVTDLMMDGMSGIELIEQIREQKNDVPIIIITGYGELETAISALRLGAADYLLKPFHTEELLLRIENCLARQELERKVKLYEKFLPVCLYCKKIRDDAGREPGKGEWKYFEEYLKVHAELDVSHGICPECYKKHVENE